MKIETSSIVYFLCIESFVCWVVVVLLLFQQASTATNFNRILSASDSILPGAQTQIDDLMNRIETLEKAAKR